MVQPLEIFQTHDGVVTIVDAPDLTRAERWKLYLPAFCFILASLPLLIISRFIGWIGNVVFTPSFILLLLSQLGFNAMNPHISERFKIGSSGLHIHKLRYSATRGPITVDDIHTGNDLSFAVESRFVAWADITTLRSDDEGIHWKTEDGTHGRLTLTEEPPSIIARLFEHMKEPWLRVRNGLTDTSEEALRGRQAALSLAEGAPMKS